MENLSAPSRTVIARVFKKVKFEERLTGYSYNARTGYARISLYSLIEVLALLNMPDPRIDFNELETWMRKVIKDKELADNLKNIIAQEGGERDKILRTRDLIAWRQIQCRQMAKIRIEERE